MGDSEIITKLIISIVIGIIIGGEREYRNKAAGLRTIVLISLGSTVFTIVSSVLGDESGANRIAANVVTGIGFLGAGAIMREGFSISGLTTASTIWVASALGMAVGMGQYVLAATALILALIVLTLFNYLQKVFFDRIRRSISFHITVDQSNNKIDVIEAQMTLLHLKFSRKKEFRKDNDTDYQYEVSGRTSDLSRFAKFLVTSRDVKRFEY